MTGIALEKHLHKIIEDDLKTKLIMTEYYDVFDYINKDRSIYVELKGRGCCKTKYPTTMIGKNKVDEADLLLKTQARIFFYFSFLDGLFKFQYTKELRSKLKLALGGRTDRGRDETKMYYYIPINLLKKV